MDLNPQDEDAAVRTMLLEAGDQGPWGMAAVAHVIRNRQATDKWGDTATSVVKSPWQFEPYMTKRREWNAINPQSDDYQHAKQILDGVYAGTITDPTAGATHFYSPVSQAAFGRAPPSWGKSATQTAQIGGHRFYAPEGRVTPSEDNLLGEWLEQDAAKGKGSDAITSHYSQADRDYVNRHQGAAPTEENLLSEWLPQEPTTNAAATPEGSTAINIPRKPFPGEMVEAKPASEGGEGKGTPAEPSVPQWVARKLEEHQGKGITEGATRFGLGALRGVGDVADTLAEGISGAGRKGADLASLVGIISPQTAKTVGNWADTVQRDVASDRDAFDRAAANSPTAQTGRIAGQIAGTGPFVEALPLAAITGRVAAPMAGPVTRLLTQGARGSASGALSGTVASGLTSSTSDQSLSDQMLTGAAGGGVLGPVGIGLSAAGRGLRRAVFGGVDAETARLASQGINQFGIPIRAGQISSSPPVRMLDSVLQRLPMSGYAKSTAAQQIGLNRAVAKEMGVSADKVTQDVIDQARRTAYTGWDQAVKNMGGTLKLDGKFYGDLGTVHQNAQAVLEDSLANKVTGLVKNVYDKMGGAQASSTMDANVYQSLVRKGGPIDNAINSKDSKIASYARDIKNALDEMVARNDPAMAQLKKEADYKYFVAKNAGKAAGPTGDISPAKLLGAVKNTQTDVGQVGRTAKRFMQEPPSSGTAERLFTMEMLKRLGVAGAVGAGAYEFDPEHLQRDAALAAIGFGATRGTSAALRSKALTNVLIRSGQTGASSAGNKLQNLITRAAPAAALTTRHLSIPVLPNNAPGQ